MDPQDALAIARDAGIDLNLLEINLSLSVAERWKQHDEALELMLELENARKIRDAELQSTAATAH